MICSFQLLPDLRVLHKYGYLNVTEVQLETAIAKGYGEELEVQYIFTYDSKQDFEEAFNQLLSKGNLQEYHDTILYIALLGNEAAYEALFTIQDAYASKKRAKELAQLLVCFKESPESQLMAFKLNTLTTSVRLTDNKLIAWVGALVAKAVSEGAFSYNDLGEGAFHLLETKDRTIQFDAPLNYEKLQRIADATVKSPKTKEKKLLAFFLYKVWQFINNETGMTTSEGQRYTDQQMNFLFDLASLFGWLDEVSIESDNKDYMYSLFQTHVKV